MGKGGRNKHPRKKTRPLPKVGTPQNDAYRLKQSRKDLVDFGVRPTQGRRNPLVVGAAVLIVFLAVVGIIALTAL